MSHMTISTTAMVGLPDLSASLGLAVVELTRCPVIFGPFVEDPEEAEHDLAPILKLIDFGSAGVIPGAGKKCV